MENINDIMQNSTGNNNSLINLRINLDKIDDFITDKKILEIVGLVKQSFPFTFIGRQKIRRVIDQLDFAFWIKDPNKKFVLVNKFFAEAVGLSLNKIEGQYQQDVLIESEAKLVSNIDDYIVNSANSVVYETYSKTFAKEMTQNIEFPITDLDKNVVAIIGYNQKMDEINSAGEKVEVQKKSNFENLPSIIVEVNKDYRVTNFTNRFLFEFSLSKDEVLGKDISALLNADLSKQVDSSSKIKIGNSQYSVELSEIKKDEEIEGYFISFNKSVDDKSSMSGKMFNQVMQYSNDPMFIYSIEDLKFLKVNEAALKLYGYSEEEFLGMDLTDLYAPEDIQTLVETSSKSTVEHGFTGPWRHTKKDGTTVLVQISKSKVDYNGVLSHFNIIKDISKDLETEKELQQYKIAFENTSDLIVFTDLEGFIKFANSRVTERLGFDKEALNDKPFLSLVNDDDRAKINTGIFHANEIKKVTLATELKKVDGDFLPVEILATPIYSHDEEVVSFGLVIIPMKQVVKEVVQKQTPIKIVKESKSKINGDFLHNLFHELLTPINVIIGFAQELAESITDPDEEQKESIDIIRDNQRTVLELMDNAIQYAQLIQHQIEINPTIVNFVDIIDSIESNVSKVSKSENVRFAYGKISSSLKFETDKQKLITIASFLVEFAMKVTKNPKVFLSAYQNDAGHCVVSVKDERTGISHELLTAMHEIFNSDEEEVRQKYGISRFMLRHARKLSDLLAEKKDVITKLNKPAEFGYIIPIRYVDREEGVIIPPQEAEKMVPVEKTTSKETEAEIQQTEDVKPKVVETEEEIHAVVAEPAPVEAAPVGKTISPPEGANRSFSDISCLYVEDQIDSQILFKVQMRDMKEIEFANSFEKSIPLLKSKQFDLIVMDINLQGEYNGLDAMRAIKKMPGYNNTPIIAVTAYILPGDRERFIKAGFNDFISKPVLRDKLEIVIDRVF
ncbi:hypothetical protein MNBD_IGNAVI01-159 [hydrothermal vent metagenome]|uniref:Uncharacterized protein n=1 Tax=hydrothermal vent metagenome TaxID=652676 RepID=A0A3B1CN68_9ZZZZ